VIAVIALAGVAALAWWRLAPRGPAAPPSGTLPDSIARLEPYPAYQRATRLGEQRDFAASLPYFQQALSVPPSAWEPYCAYGTSLFHATHQVRVHRGVQQPVTRSSWERVALMNEAARQLDTAERLARTPKEQAFVIAAHAQQVGVWGMPWNAVSEYVRAAVGAPGERLHAGAYLARLEHPLVGPAPEPDSTTTPRR
jgi:hypothetical protein